MKLLLPFFLLLTFGAYSQKGDSYYKAAEKYAKAENYDLALQSIDHALKLDSVNLDYWAVKLECLKEQKKWQELFDGYTKVIAMHPDVPWLYCNRGSLLTNLGYFDEAIEDFNTGIVINQPDSVKMDFLIGRSAAELGKRAFSDAYNDLVNAYRIDSTNLGVLVNLSVACDETGRDSDVMLYLQKALALSPKDVAVIGNIGFKYQKMGDYKTSIEYFNKVLAIDPREGQAYCNRSYSYFKMGDIKTAKEDIEKAILYYPGNSYAYRGRALIYIEEKNYGAACTDLQTAIDKGFTVSYGPEVQELKDKYCKQAAQ